MNRGVEMELSAEHQSLLASPQEEDRLQGIRALADLGGEAQLRILLSCLGDASWRVRKEACDQFLEIGRAHV